MKNGLPCGEKMCCFKSTLPGMVVGAGCAAMVLAGIIGAIQIQVNRQVRRDADFDIDG
jgi:hypothetical protein